MKLSDAAMIFFYAIKGTGSVVDQSTVEFNEDPYSTPQMKALVRRNVSQGYGALLTIFGLLFGFSLDIGVLSVN